MNTNTALRNSIISLLFLIPFVPLVVSTSLYFPYITGKAFAFRVLIELALILYCFLIIRDRSYLPKKSVLLWSMAGFAFVLLLATLFSHNIIRSFWSNFERMEGYITMLHLFAYFVMLAGVYSKKTWFWFVHTALFASIIVGLFGIADKQDRIAGTLGNSSYLGVYALLHLFLAGYFLVQTIKKRWNATDKEFIPWTIGYAILVIFNTYVLYRTGTRGAFLGLLIGGGITILLLAIFERTNKIVRKTSIAMLIILVVAIGGLGLGKNTSIVKNNTLLSRFSAITTLDIKSVVANEGRARTIIWSMAWQGFKERPILGWGQDNFNYVFAKYYDPRMYDQEQWFDRSHNVFFDWLIAGGILGLVGYLSLFASMIYLMWRKKYQELLEEPWEFTEKVILTGLLIAYFIHNLFVFDNLASYLIFFALLAYVHFRSTTYIERKENHQPLFISPGVQWTVGGVIAVIIFGVMYVAVVKPYAEASYIIKGLQAHAGSVDSTGKKIAPDETVTLAYFQKAFDQHTFGDAETLERFSDTAGAVIATQGVPDVVKQNFSALLDEQYVAQFKRAPDDPRYYLFYGLYFAQLGQYDQAVQYLDKGVALSPNKQSFLFQAGIVYYEMKNYTKAIEYMKHAYEVDTSDKEALSLYATILIYSGQYDVATKEIAAAEARGVSLGFDARVIQAYMDKKQYQSVIDFFKPLIAADPNNGQLHVSLAAAYIKAGNRAAAIKEIQAAMAIEPAFEAQGEYFIKEIQAGRDPSTVTQTTTQ